MQCTIEIFDRGQWQPCCIVETENPSAGSLSPSVLTYLPDYVENGSLPVSIHFPVRKDPYHLSHWPSFLLDMVPRGEGREYLLYECHIPEEIATDWKLMLVGAINPIGNLRIAEANVFYRNFLSKKAPLWVNRGFTIKEILERSENFVEYLEEHGMLSAGTTSVQGKTPKFLMTQDKNGLWYADAALPDARAARHFLVKLSRGRNLADWKILENEAAYVRVAREMGLAVGELPKWQSDMLFISRFDRTVTETGVIRHHQESIASLCQLADASERPSHNVVLKTLRKFVSDPFATTVEYLKRDILNMAMGNIDNHPFNKAVRMLDGKIGLTPIFDFSPSYLLTDDIERSMEWVDKNGDILDNWNDILDSLDIPPEEMSAVLVEIDRFGRKLDSLQDIMTQQGVDEDIVDARYYGIQNLRSQLKN